jgi:hypothetical protein
LNQIDAQSWPFMVLNSLAKVNFHPMFAKFHHVFIPYCDGASFAGDRLEPMRYQNTALFFRGRRVLEFVLASLRQKHGLGAATHMLFGGGSAGGLATYLGADRLSMAS